MCNDTAVKPFILQTHIFLWRTSWRMRHRILTFCGASIRGCATEISGLTLHVGPPPVRPDNSVVHLLKDAPQNHKFLWRIPPEVRHRILWLPLTCGATPALPLSSPKFPKSRARARAVALDAEPSPPVPRRALPPVPRRASPCPPPVPRLCLAVPVPRRARALDAPVTGRNLDAPVPALPCP